MLAHEFAHIKNRDILVSSIAATVAGAIAAIAEVLQWSLIFGGSEDEDAGPLGWIGPQPAAAPPRRIGAQCVTRKATSST